MTTFMRQLRTFARTYGLCILVSATPPVSRMQQLLFHEQVLNGTSAAQPNNPLSVFPETVRKPALGPTFTFMTDATLWLARAKTKQRTEDPPDEDPINTAETHVAEVFRSRSTVSPFIISGVYQLLYVLESLQGRGAHSKCGMVCCKAGNGHCGLPAETNFLGTPTRIRYRSV